MWLCDLPKCHAALKHSAVPSVSQAFHYTLSDRPKNMIKKGNQIHGGCKQGLLKLIKAKAVSKLTVIKA